MVVEVAVGVWDKLNTSDGYIYGKICKMKEDYPALNHFATSLQGENGTTPIKLKMGVFLNAFRN